MLAAKLVQLMVGMFEKIFKKLIGKSNLVFELGAWLNIKGMKVT